MMCHIDPFQKQSVIFLDLFINIRSCHTQCSSQTMWNVSNEFGIRQIENSCWYAPRRIFCHRCKFQVNIPSHTSLLTLQRILKVTKQLESLRSEHWSASLSSNLIRFLLTNSNALQQCSLPLRFRVYNVLILSYLLLIIGSITSSQSLIG